jgi:hypothetical protein
MRQAEFLVFNDIIYAGAISYTIASFNDTLAEHDMIAAMAVIDNVSTASTGFDLYIQHSCDGRNWLTRNSIGQGFTSTLTPGFGDITLAGMGLNNTYARMYSDAALGITKQNTSAGGPMLGYVRFGMIVTLGFAHVKVYAVLRDTTVPVAKHKRQRIGQ